MYSFDSCNPEIASFSRNKTSNKRIHWTCSDSHLLNLQLGSRCAREPGLPRRIDISIERWRNGSVHLVVKRRFTTFLVKQSVSLRVAGARFRNATCLSRCCTFAIYPGPPFFFRFLPFRPVTVGSVHGNGLFFLNDEHAPSDSYLIGRPRGVWRADRWPCNPRSSHRQIERWFSSVSKKKCFGNRVNGYQLYRVHLSSPEPDPLLAQISVTRYMN